MTKRANLSARLAPPSTAGNWTRAIVRALCARGLDGRALAAEVGVDVADLDNATSRVSMRANGELWRRATDLTADPCFGLYASRFVAATMFQPLGAAVFASATLRDAFARVARYWRLFTDANQARLEEDCDRVRFVLDDDPDSQPPDEAIDSALSLMLRIARLLRESRELRPVRVELKRVQPSPSDAFDRFFRTPIIFRAARNAIEFARSDFDAPLPNGNTEVTRWLDQVLARSVGLLAADGIVNQVRAALFNRPADSASTANVIAKALGMSRRSLQRRLTGAGVSYQAVRNETRMMLARSYFAQGWSVTDVALALGFSGSSSFSRAYRRWTGRLPSESP